MTLWSLKLAESSEWSTCPCVLYPCMYTASSADMQSPRFIHTAYTSLKAADHENCFVAPKKKGILISHWLKTKKILFEKPQEQNESKFSSFLKSNSKYCNGKHFMMGKWLNYYLKTANWFQKLNWPNLLQQISRWIMLSQFTAAAKAGTAAGHWCQTDSGVLQVLQVLSTLLFSHTGPWYLTQCCSVIQACTK